MCHFVHFVHFRDFRKCPKMYKVSIMPLCIIKNGALIFREKGAGNGFLRTFETVWEYVCGKSVEEGGLFFKPLILRDSDNWKVCAQFANCANYANSHFSQKSQFAQVIKVKTEKWKRKGERNPSVATRQLPYKQGSKKVHSPLKKV